MCLRSVVLAWIGCIALAAAAMAQPANPAIRPTFVWTWAKHPGRADVARVYPAAAGPDLTSFGSIDCVLDAQRRPSDCKPGLDGSPEIGFSKAILVLAPLWQGPEAEGANLAVGAPISIILTFQPAEEMISEPSFVFRDDAQKPLAAVWTRRPSLEEITKIIPDDVVGYSMASVQCKVGQNGKLGNCSFAISKSQCDHADGSKDCSPVELRAMIPSDPRLLKLGDLLRAPLNAPEGGSSTGRRVRFFVNLQPLSPPPLALPPPPLNYRQVVQELRLRRGSMIRRSPLFPTSTP